MKNRNLLQSVALLLFISLSLISCDSQKIVPSSELPAEITEYTSTHFPDDKIVQSTIKRDGLKRSFDIILESNTSLEFNGRKDIVEIDGNSKLPKSVIPDKIANHVAHNFTGRIITDWEREDRGQQIKLDNGMELKFSKAGDFIRVDD